MNIKVDFNFSDIVNLDSTSLPAHIFIQIVLELLISYIETYRNKFWNPSFAM